MVFIRFTGWAQPVRLERREASRIIFTVFVKHGFGGWIPLENGPEFAAFRGDSIGLAPPDPNADRISIDLPDREAAEDVVRTQLASMRPVLGGGFELDVDLSQTPEAIAIFAEIEADLRAQR